MEVRIFVIFHIFCVLKHANSLATPNSDAMESEMLSTQNTMPQKPNAYMSSETTSSILYPTQLFTLSAGQNSLMQSHKNVSLITQLKSSLLKEPRSKLSFSVWKSSLSSQRNSLKSSQLKSWIKKSVMSPQVKFSLLNPQKKSVMSSQLKSSLKVQRESMSPHVRPSLKTQRDSIMSSLLKLSLRLQRNSLMSSQLSSSLKSQRNSLSQIISSVSSHQNSLISSQLRDSLKSKPGSLMSSQEKPALNSQRNSVMSSQAKSSILKSQRNSVVSSKESSILKSQRDSVISTERIPSFHRLSLAQQKSLILYLQRSPDLERLGPTASTDIRMPLPNRRNLPYRPPNLPHRPDQPDDTTPEDKGRYENLLEPYWPKGDWVYKRTIVPYINVVRNPPLPTLSTEAFVWNQTTDSTTTTETTPVNTETTTMSNTTTETPWVNYQCQHPCNRLYESYGRVCAQRFNLIEYETKQFENICDMLEENCVYHYTERSYTGYPDNYRGLWYVIIRGPCYYIYMTPLEPPVTDVRILIANVDKYNTMNMYLYRPKRWRK